MPPRADPRDGLVGCTLAGLPAGGLVATGSARRRAQLAYLRPDLVFTQLRGNMARRVAVGEDGSVSAVVVAVAAMERLGWVDRLSDVLDPVDVLPQAGQGAVAVQCRADDEGTRRLLGAIDHEPSHRALRGRAGGAGHPGRELHRARRGLRRGGGRRGACPAGRVRPDGQRRRAHGRPHGPPGARTPRRVGAELARALLEGGGAAIEGFGGVAPGVAAGGTPR